MQVSILGYSTNDIESSILVLGDNTNDGFAHLNEAYTHQNIPHPRADEALTISKLFLQRQNKGRELSLPSVANTISADEWMIDIL